jgi:putative colanic acid biosysnthesis UDP-glucose lipid carrier transferase
MSQAAVRYEDRRPRATAAAPATILPLPARVPASPVASSRAKRLLDVLGALLALILFLPLMLVIALAIRVESGGPTIFRQRRTGHNGRVFTILKFRTMVVAEDCEGLRQATRGDVRITAVGALLRKLSLDELPQIINVLRGHMSLVGPRPHALAHDEQYARLIPTYNNRFRAKPGLTGRAQVSGLRGEIHDLSGMSDRVDADNAYIDSWSLAADFAILARTAVVIFRDPHAY